MRNFYLVCLTVLLCLSKTTAHLSEEYERMSRAEYSRRQLAANQRHVLARRCGSAFDGYQAQRKARRSLGYLPKRQDETTATTASATTPHFSTIQNTTCITAPEVIEGPYYINNEQVRTDLREDQSGITIVLDIGVMDVTTCEPLPSVFVELWNCNATGFYAGFTAASASVGGGSAGGPPSSGSMALPSVTGSMSSIPSGSPGGGTGGGATSTDAFTWLRGGSSTDPNGIVELTTIYPGFYTGRTVHIHIMVHQNFTVASNGTIESHSGSVRHIGQLFFDEDLNAQVLATSAYLNTTMTRTTNAEDDILAQENSNGYNAFVDVTMLGNSIEDGLLGYITIGVNSSASHSIASTNYNSGSTLIESSTSAAQTSQASSAKMNRNTLFSWIFS